MHMRRQPIPRRLLPHSAQLYAETTDEWQHQQSNLIASLDHIRIDVDQTGKSDEANATRTVHWLLFYDCCNSRPADVSFVPGQVILWQDHRLTVHEAAPVWDDHTLHHWEVKLEGS